MGCHIQVRDLTLTHHWKTFHKNIFAHLNLCIETGCFVSVVGRNGSGKSSFIRLILGLVNPNQGEVLIDGVRLEAGYPVTVREHRISYIAQQIEELFYADTPREELLYGKTTPAADQAHICDALGLTGLLDRMIETLSGGERQALALAQFMLQPASLLILDEPTSYLDSERATFLKHFLIQAHSQGKTILHVTQYQSEANWGTHVLDLDHKKPCVVAL